MIRRGRCAGSIQSPAGLGAAAVRGVSLVSFPSGSASRLRARAGAGSAVAARALSAVALGCGARAADLAGRDAPGTAARLWLARGRRRRRGRSGLAPARRRVPGTRQPARMMRVATFSAAVRATVGQDRGVGVGGQHDAGVAEHVLHDVQVHPGGQGQRGRAVPKVVQPDRRQPGLARPARKVRVSRSGAIGSPFRPVNTIPALPVAGPVGGGLGAAAGRGARAAPRRWCGPGR